jgi:hypothetical protein
MTAAVAARTGTPAKSTFTSIRIGGAARDLTRQPPDDHELDDCLARW